MNNPLGPQRARKLNLFYADTDSVKNLNIDYKAPAGEEFVLLVLGTAKRGEPISKERWHELVAQFGLRFISEEV